ncbi:unnamed protein product [Callosobruchus maculatus]|uniref:Uncharacterized protein n=1 Tax=Callosobruchus maculatus TaxID=64391 RepID=A0A653CTB8_CALMS|nr:unnamed protein product [Callosobruchus maculatus]
MLMNRVLGVALLAVACVHAQNGPIGSFLTNVGDLFGYDVFRRPRIVIALPAAPAAPPPPPAAPAAPAAPPRANAAPAAAPAAAAPAQTPLLTDSVRRVFSINLNWDRNRTPGQDNALPPVIVTPRIAPAAAAPQAAAAPAPALPPAPAGPALPPRNLPPLPRAAPDVDDDVDTLEDRRKRYYIEINTEDKDKAEEVEQNKEKFKREFDNFWQGAPWKFENGDQKFVPDEDQKAATKEEPANENTVRVTHKIKVFSKPSFEDLHDAVFSPSTEVNYYDSPDHEPYAQYIVPHNVDPVAFHWQVVNQEILDYYKKKFANDAKAQKELAERLRYQGQPTNEDILQYYSEKFKSDAAEKQKAASQTDHLLEDDPVVTVEQYKHRNSPLTYYYIDFPAPSPYIPQDRQRIVIQNPANVERIPLVPKQSKKAEALPYKSSDNSNYYTLDIPSVSLGQSHRITANDNLFHRKDKSPSDLKHPRAEGLNDKYSDDDTSKEKEKYYDDSSKEKEKYYSESSKEKEKVFDNEDPKEDEKNHNEKQKEKEKDEEEIESQKKIEAIKKKYYHDDDSAEKKQPEKAPKEDEEEEAATEKYYTTEVDVPKEAKRYFSSNEDDEPKEKSESRLKHSEDDDTKHQKRYKNKEEERQGEEEKQGDEEEEEEEESARPVSETKVKYYKNKGEDEEPKGKSDIKEKYYSSNDDVTSKPENQKHEDSDEDESPKPVRKYYKNSEEDTPKPKSERKTKYYNDENESSKPIKKYYKEREEETPKLKSESKTKYYKDDEGPKTKKYYTDDEDDAPRKKSESKQKYYTSVDDENPKSNKRNYHKNTDEEVPNAKHKHYSYTEDDSPKIEGNSSKAEEEEEDEDPKSKQKTHSKTEDDEAPEPQGKIKQNFHSHVEDEGSESSNPIKEKYYGKQDDEKHELPKERQEAIRKYYKEKDEVEKKYFGNTDDALEDVPKEKEESESKQKIYNSDEGGAPKYRDEVKKKYYAKEDINDEEEGLKLRDTVKKKYYDDDDNEKIKENNHKESLEVERLEDASSPQRRNEKEDDDDEDEKESEVNESRTKEKGSHRDDDRDSEEDEKPLKSYNQKTAYEDDAQAERPRDHIKPVREDVREDDENRRSARPNEEKEEEESKQVKIKEEEQEARKKAEKEAAEKEAAEKEAAEREAAEEEERDKIAAELQEKQKFSLQDIDDFIKTHFPEKPYNSFERIRDEIHGSVGVSDDVRKEENAKSFDDHLSENASRHPISKAIDRDVSTRGQDEDKEEEHAEDEDEEAHKEEEDDDREGSSSNRKQNTHNSDDGKVDEADTISKLDKLHGKSFYTVFPKVSGSPGFTKKTEKQEEKPKIDEENKFNIDDYIPDLKDFHKSKETKKEEEKTFPNYYGFREKKKDNENVGLLYGSASKSSQKSVPDYFNYDYSEPLKAKPKETEKPTFEFVVDHSDRFDKYRTPKQNMVEHTDAEKAAYPKELRFQDKDDFESTGKTVLQPLYSGMLNVGTIQELHTPDKPLTVPFDFEYSATENKVKVKNHGHSAQILTRARRETKSIKGNVKNREDDEYRNKKENPEETYKNIQVQDYMVNVPDIIKQYENTKEYVPDAGYGLEDYEKLTGAATKTTSTSQTKIVKQQPTIKKYADIDDEDFAKFIEDRPDVIREIEQAQEYVPESYNLELHYEAPEPIVATEKTETNDKKKQFENIQLEADADPRAKDRKARSSYDHDDIEEHHDKEDQYEPEQYNDGFNYEASEPKLPDYEKVEKKDFKDDEKLSPNARVTYTKEKGSRDTVIKIHKPTKVVYST